LEPSVPTGRCLLSLVRGENESRRCAMHLQSVRDRGARASAPVAFATSARESVSTAWQFRDRRPQTLLLTPPAYVHVPSPPPLRREGKLFEDERCANIFEALNGTLRAASQSLLPPPPLSVFSWACRASQDAPSNYRLQTDVNVWTEKRKLVTFEGEMLLQGAHNDVDVVIL
jgi:hypothetical protein